jgi:hypothetical protein
MRDKKPPRPRRHGSEKMVDRIGNEDQSGVGRKGGADIDVEKREKELEGPQ